MDFSGIRVSLVGQGYLQHENGVNMSGIGMVIDRSGGHRVDRALTEQMATALAHGAASPRTGTWYSADRSVGVATAGQPLIVSAAEQPAVFWDENRRVAVILYGSIFNYFELRAEAEADGIAFRSSMPEEAVLRAYMNMGTAVFRQLEGMFSLIIIDLRYDQVIIARDAFGRRPFYYYAGSDWFAAASEMRFLIQTIPGPGIWKCCHEGLSDYLIFGYNVRQRTVVEGIQKVLPGEVLVVSLTGEIIQQWHYWSLPAVNPFSGSNVDDAYRRFKVRFESAVERELEGSDMSVDLLLSGGVDSTAVFCAAIEQGHLPGVFTLRNPKNKDCGSYDAEQLARANGVNCTVIPAPDPLTHQTLLDAMSAFDEPFCNPDAVGLDLLAQAMGKTGRRCALVGDGGNELMIGYNHYREYVRCKAQHNNRWWIPFGDFLQHVPTTQALILNWAQLYAERFSKIPQWVRRNMLDEDFRSLEHESVELIRKTMYDQVGRTAYDFLARFDYHFSLPDDLLVKIDRVAARHELEFRTPLVDRDLTTYMVTLPETVRLYFENEPKWMLRRYIREHGGSAPWVNSVLHRNRHGFHVAATQALGKVWDRVSEWVYDDDFLWWTSLRRYGVEQAMSRKSGAQKISRPGWIVFSLYLWWRRYICNNPVVIE